MKKPFCFIITIKKKLMFGPMALRIPFLGVESLKDLIIYGAGDLGRECLWYIEQFEQRWNLLGFLDDNLPAGMNVSQCPVLGGADWFKTYSGEVDVICAIALPAVKKKIVGQLRGYPNVSFPVLIHPTSLVAESVLVGDGTIIGPGCGISVDTTIGAHVLINMATHVGHDVVVGDCAELAPGCILGGHVIIGEGTSLGMRTSVLPGVTIGARAKLGAGSVVVHPIPADCTAVGVPARPIKMNNVRIPK